MDKKDIKLCYIGMRLKQLRVGRKMTQTDLGLVLDLTKSAVSRIESGDRTINIFALLDAAIYFEVTTDYILGLN